MRPIILLLIALFANGTSGRSHSLDRLKRQAEGDAEKPNVALIEWQRLFKEVFTSTKSEVSPKDAHEKIQRLGEGLKNKAVSQSIDPYLKEEIEFWVEAANIDVTKCDIEYDDQLARRYQEAFLRFPISEKKGRRAPIKVFLDDIRKQQAKECKDLPQKLQKLVDDLPQNVFNAVIKIERGVSDDYVRNAAYVLAPHYKNVNFVWGLIAGRPENDRELFDKLYDEHIVRPCERILQPFKIMKGFVKYAQRYNLRTGMNLDTRDWLHTYVDICIPFVMESKEQTKLEVFESLPNVLQMYRLMSKPHQAMYLQESK